MREPSIAAGQGVASRDHRVATLIVTAETETVVVLAAAAAVVVVDAAEAPSKSSILWN
jgi:hypothetical protein